MIGDAPYPKAAPPVFPLPGHGTMAEVIAKEADTARRSSEEYLELAAEWSDAAYWRHHRRLMEIGNQRMLNALRKAA